MKKIRPLFINTFHRHQKTFQATRTILPEIEKGAKILANAIKNNHRLFVCGNGGSAADAQHITGEFLCRFKNDRQPLPAFALTVDTSALTAIGNDYDFTKVFARQLQALAEKDDILLAISTSGRSPNILAAIDVALAKKMKVVILTGEKGNGLRKKYKDCLVVAVPATETARIQEMHQLIYHSWCEFVDSVLGS